VSVASLKVGDEFVIARVPTCPSSVNAIEALPETKPERNAGELRPLLCRIDEYAVDRSDLVEIAASRAEVLDQCDWIGEYCK